MDNNEEDFMKEKLDDLTDLINKAYLPLVQGKPDTRL